MTLASLIHTYVKFKDKEAGDRAFFLSAQCIEIMNDMAAWCEDRQLPFVVTATVSTPDEDHCLNRVSSTHREGRAFDISIHGWLEVAISEFIRTFSDQFLHVAALGGATNKPELIVRHNNGNGDHMHVQVAKVFGVPDPLSL